MTQRAHRIAHPAAAPATAPTAPRIASLADAAIGHPATAERWMHARSQLFGGRTPLEALDNPEGRRRVARQLQWFAGRHLSSRQDPVGAGLAVEDPGLRR
jgi:hypothetical protein